MLLYLNTFITDTPIPGRSNMVQWRNNNRKFLVTPSAFDIFKYCLASYAVAYDWSRVILKVSLDEEFLPRQKELEDFIKKEFAGRPINLFWERNLYQKDWQSTYDLIDDNLIWFGCNHDHIFLDHSKDYLKRLVSLMEMESDGAVSCGYSHWPEGIQQISKNRMAKEVQVFDDYATLNCPHADSMHIISKSMYYNWWFSTQLPPDLKFPRTDWPYNMICNMVPLSARQKNFVAFKELCRHFDAYYHLDMHQCGAIEIPPGFFDSNIKLSIGETRHSPEHTWINPMGTKYKSENGVGADCLFGEEEIPLVWKSRISDITRPVDIDLEQMVENRMKIIIDMMYSEFQEPMIFDQPVLEKILNVWIKPYGMQL